MSATAGGRTPKTERLEARLTREQKELVLQASDLSGRSLPDFVAEALVDAARTTIRDHQLLLLTMRESGQLAAALADPPEPTPHLREAWARRFAEP